MAKWRAAKSAGLGDEVHRPAAAHAATSSGFSSIELCMLGEIRDLANDLADL